MSDLGELYRGDVVRVTHDKRGRKRPYPRVGIVESIDLDHRDGPLVWVRFRDHVDERGRWSGPSITGLKPGSFVKLRDGDGRMPHERMPLLQAMWNQDDPDYWEEDERDAQAHEGRAPGPQASGGDRRSGD